MSTRTCTHTCTHLHTHLYTDLHTHLHESTCTHTCTRTCRHRPTHTPAQKHLHTHTCTHRVPLNLSGVQNSAFPPCRPVCLQGNDLRGRPGVYLCDLCHVLCTGQLCGLPHPGASQQGQTHAVHQWGAATALLGGQLYLGHGKMPSKRLRWYHSPRSDCELVVLSTV